MEKLEKHHAAYISKLNGFSNTDIAKIYSVSINTVTAWSKKHGWKEKIEQKQLFEETSSARIQNLIQYQLKILEAIAKKKSEVLENIDSAELKQLNDALISKGDLDAFQKLFTTIKGKQLNYDHKVKIVTDFLKYTEQTDLNLAKKITALTFEYIEYLRRQS